MTSTLASAVPVLQRLCHPLFFKTRSFLELIKSTHTEEVVHLGGVLASPVGWKVLCLDFVEEQPKLRLVGLESPCGKEHVRGKTRQREFRYQT